MTILLCYATKVDELVMMMTKCTRRTIKTRRLLHPLVSMAIKCHYGRRLNASWINEGSISSNRFFFFFWGQAGLEAKHEGIIYTADSVMCVCCFHV